MDEYIIGAGAVLTAGPRAGIARATLHARTDPSLASLVRAAVIDFEASRCGDLSRIVVIGVGWNGSSVRNALVEPLMSAGECSLADVMLTLAEATASRDVHLFARWLPGEDLTEALRRRGRDLVAHPLETIRAAALVSGQTYSRPAPASGPSQGQGSGLL